MAFFSLSFLLGFQSSTICTIIKHIYQLTTTPLLFFKGTFSEFTLGFTYWFSWLLLTQPTLFVLAFCAYVDFILHVLYAIAFSCSSEMICMSYAFDDNPLTYDEWMNEWIIERCNEHWYYYWFPNMIQLIKQLPRTTNERWNYKGYHCYIAARLHIPIMSQVSKPSTYQQACRPPLYASLLQQCRVVTKRPLQPDRAVVQY